MPWLRKLVCMYDLVLTLTGFRLDGSQGRILYGELKLT